MLIGGKVELGHEVESVRLDANGYVYVIGSSGSPVYCKAGDDAAGGGPYYLRTDADGALLVGTDGTDGTLLRTDANGRLQLANYNAITNANRTSEVDPLSEHYLGPIVVDIAGQTDGTFDYYIDLSTYREMALQIVDVPGAAGDNTYTVLGTVLDDGTAPAACPYQNIGNAVYGAANWVTSAMLLDAERVAGQFKYINVHVVRANDAANSDGGWSIYAKKLW